MSITVTGERILVVHIWIVITEAMTIRFVQHSVAVQDVFPLIVLFDLLKFLGSNHVLQPVDIDIG